MELTSHTKNQIARYKPSTKHNQLPKSVKQRLSNNFSNETIFSEAAPPYEKAISEAGYDIILKYNPNKKTKQKNRKKNIIWYNPPYCKDLATKVGHYFLKLLDKHFS